MYEINDMPEKTDRHKLLEKINLMLGISIVLILSLGFAKRDIILRNILTALILLISVIIVFITHKSNNPEIRWLRVFIPLALVVIFVLDMLITEEDLLAIIVSILFIIGYMPIFVIVRYKDHKRLVKYLQERKEEGNQSGNDLDGKKENH